MCPCVCQSWFLKEKQQEIFSGQFTIKDLDFSVTSDVGPMPREDENLHKGSLRLGHRSKTGKFYTHTS